MTAKQKKKLGIWGIVAAVVITIGVTAYIAITAGVFTTKGSSQEQAIVNQVWGGKAPTAAEEKKIVDQVVNSQWPPPNPFLTAPVVAPVVVPPVQSGFKAEYKITGPAEKEIEFKFVTGEAGYVSWELTTLTDKPLVINRLYAQRDAYGNLLDGSRIEITIKGNPGEVVRKGREKIEPGAKTMTFSLWE